jgi:hypothetical protein
MKKIIDEQWFEENYCLGGCSKMECSIDVKDCDHWKNLPDAPEKLMIDDDPNTTKWCSVENIKIKNGKIEEKK